MSAALAARLAALKNASASPAAPAVAPISAVVSASLPAASVVAPAATVAAPVAELPSIAGLSYVQLIELLEAVTKEIKKQSKGALKPSVKKASKASSGSDEEKKPRVVGFATQVWFDFLAHIRALLKEKPEMDKDIADPKNPGKTKKAGPMVIASEMRDSNSKVYLDFIASKGITLEQIASAKKPVKPKKTDEEKAAEKLEKLQKKVSTKKAAPITPAAPAATAATAATATATADDDADTIDFQLNGKSYTRMISGETYEILPSGEYQWAGMYNAVANKIDAAPEPTA
jgi:hypothetical protein